MRAARQRSIRLNTRRRVQRAGYFAFLTQKAQDGRQRREANPPLAEAGRVQPRFVELNRVGSKSAMP